MLFSMAAKEYHWTPDTVLGLTCFEMIDLFVQEPKKKPKHSRIELLKVLNDNLAKKGQRPTIPDWVWSKLAHKSIA